MVDVGCGIGGSSRHISRQFGCTSRGITLSPVQAARANELSAAAGLGDRCSFQVRVSCCSQGRLSVLMGWVCCVPRRYGLVPLCQSAEHGVTRVLLPVRTQVADALQQPFADGSFDLVWSMESGEHMPEKERFVNELCRVAAPGVLRHHPTCADIPAVLHTVLAEPQRTSCATL
jgi:tocopherol O-methyltransferase